MYTLKNLLCKLNILKQISCMLYIKLLFKVIMYGEEKYYMKQSLMHIYV